MVNRTMKDSKVKWIGDIPDNWEVKPLKYIANIQTGNTPSMKNKHYYSDNGIDWVKTNNLLGTKGVKESEVKLSIEGSKVARIAKAHSTLVSCIGDVGKMGYITSDSAYNQQINAVTFNEDDVFWKYGMYYISVQKEQHQYYQNGNVLKILNTENQKRVVVPVPKIEEQKKIAAFLDEKVAHIDNIIENTKKSIENLKFYKQSLITETVTKGLDSNVEMKDSGIEWVGKIPKHWMLRKIKHLTSKIGSGKTPRGGGNIYSNEGILFLRSQNIYETGLYLENATYISPEIDDSMKSTRVYSNDVLLNITGGSIGRACVYPQYIETHANVNQHVCILRPIQEYTHPSYLFYYLISHVGRNYIRYYQTGGNREGLNFEQIGNFAIPSFSIHEQTKIVNYLDEKTSQVDQIVNQQKQLVKEFESYKRSIIYEYVTGKKEVK
ncbi:restriction endonuclease subunit S [Enterococcus casseliflavus]|uniref:restriction endonuclease subunit S n=1 Tax=Enterococcus casseliflavus TaxID=37734 RepID=UPI0039FBEFE2